MKTTNKKKHLNTKSEAIIISTLYFLIACIWFGIFYVLNEIFHINQGIIRLHGLFFILMSTLLLYFYSYTKLKKYEKLIMKIVDAYNKLSNLNQNSVILSSQLEDQSRVFEEIKLSLKDDLNLTISSPNDIVWDWDIVNDNYYFSDKWKEVFGYDELENTFETLKNLIHPDDLSKALTTINDYLNGKTLTYHNIYRVKTSEGKYRWILSRGKAIWENGIATRFTGTHLDITEKQELEKRLYNLAYYDAVTKLPNRAYLEIEINKHINNNNSNFAIAYIDLDNFKHINEVKGHDAGDALLKYIAETLTKNLKEPNIVGNIIGDEFVVAILDSKNFYEISNSIRNIFDLLRKPWHYHSQDFFITTSIGVAMYPDHGTTFQELLINADLARNYAKEKGKDQFVFYNLSIRDKTLKQIELSNMLRSAILNDELILYYQPQIDIKTNKIVAFEALLRWNHPEKGFISPADFIPVAEKNGFIDQITEYVFEKAFKQKLEWNKKGLRNVRMTINISPLIIKQEGLTIKLKKLFNRYDVRPDEFEMEITETAVMLDLEKAVYNLMQLKSLGVRIALDDFGSGYSSLTYLQELPIDVLKLDQKLIKMINTEYDEAYILKMIIDMAHYLGLKVVAEGVETHEQLQVMARHKCDIIQGFYYSRPLPSDKIEEKYLFARIG